MYQNIELIGRLGRDPENRYAPDGTAVTNFDIAVDGGKDKTVWVRITAWDKLAETCGSFLHKGSVVHVTGSFAPDKATGNPRVFQRKDGTWSAVFEVLARRVTFLSPKSEGAQAQDYSDLF